jgi:ubiquinone/menaquinone biosynthesis C-methylase UbiE
MLAKPISEYLHQYIASKLKNYQVKTLLDIGGKGKMNNRSFDTTNADIKYGIDGRNLPFEDNSFDATISVATLEHVGNIEEQKKFLIEANRVAKKVSIHWFPFNEDAEKFLKEIGHNHPCVVPTQELLYSISSLKPTLIQRTTVKEHFLLLATIYPKLNTSELYNYIFKHGQETFGIFLEIRK